MKSRSPLDFDISVSADKRRRAKQRGFVGETGTDARKCEWRGCSNPGTYRAPRSRDDLNSFRWYCKDHIREFNKSWNYYADYTPEELEAQRKAELAWERPTWKMGDKAKKPEGATGHADGQAWRRFGFDDPLEVLGDNATINPGGQGEAQRARARPAKRRHAGARGRGQQDQSARFPQNGSRPGRGGGFRRQWL